jgi:hypothetical protein
VSVVVFRGFLERGVVISFFSGYLAHAVVQPSVFSPQRRRETERGQLGWSKFY